MGRPAFRLATAILVTSLSFVTAARADGPASRVLPASTKAYAAITDWPTFCKRWEASAFGKMLGDQNFKVIRDDIGNAGMDIHGLGININTLNNVGAGEVSWAVVRLGPEAAAHLFIVDTKGNSDKAKTLLAEALKNLQSQSGKLGTQNVGGITVHTFTSPNRYVAVAQKGSLVICANSLPAMHELLDNSGKATLAATPAFIETQKQAKSRLKNEADLTWFVDPLGLLDTQRLSNRKIRQRGPDILHVLQREGFTGIKGAGGVLRFGDGEDIVSHTAIFAPKPYTKAMRMLAFPPAKDFSSPAWLPGDLALYGSVCYDMKQGFNHLAPLFDAVYGDNEQGTFNDVLKALRDDPDGPRVDIANDIVAKLGPRVNVVLDTAATAMSGGGGALFCVEAKEEKHVADAIRRLMKDDPEVQRHEIAGFECWEILEKKKLAKPDGTTSIHTNSKGILAVARGQLLYCDDVRFLQNVLSGKATPPAPPQGNLAQVGAVLKQYITGQDSLLFVSRLAEEFHGPYEAFRQHKEPSRQFIHGQVFNGVMSLIYRGDRSKLPTFDRLSPHLGFAGIVGSSTETGWILSGVILKKN